MLNDANVLGAGQNKFLNSITLAQHGLPHVEAHLVGSVVEALISAEQLGYPLVIKPVIGAKGMDVVELVDQQALASVVPLYLRDYAAVYLQRHVAKPGRDIRVSVVDYRAVCAFYRYAPPGAFVTNLSAGGTWEDCPIDSTIRELAEGAARAFHAKIAGVDLIEEAEAYRILEVNTTPSITVPHSRAVPAVLDWLERELAMGGQRAAS